MMPLSNRDEIDSAIVRGDLDAVRTWLAVGHNINELNSEGWPAIFTAVLAGSPEILLILLDHGAEINVELCEPAATVLAPRLLDLAMQMRKFNADVRFVEIVRILLERGARST
jgi:hypothetical protein